MSMRLTEDPAGLPYKLAKRIGLDRIIGPIRLTEDPAGLPYKLASRRKSSEL
jgi:hypothetical protein